ncbi:hypothetical protein MAUB1S_00774 [Mycolicibacterium aubagnense]
MRSKPTTAMTMAATISPRYQIQLGPAKTVLKPEVARIVLKTLKPMYTKITATNGTRAPREPNWARDWIICGRPIVGPWLAWKHMKSVPKQAPATAASTDHPADKPLAGPRKPVTIVVNTKFPVNQNGAW